MNKGDLVDAVARELGVPKVAASRSVEAVINALIEGVAEHDKVAISGFGTFKKKHRKERTGRNPATKEPIHIPAHKTMGFTPSQALKSRMEPGGAAESEAGTGSASVEAKPDHAAHADTQVG